MNLRSAACAHAEQSNELLLHTNARKITDMQIDVELIPTNVLKLVAAAGSVTSARIESGDKGLVITFRLGLTERLLGAARGGVRYFHSLDGAAAYLVNQGIVQFEVDIPNWRPAMMARSYKRSQAILNLSRTTIKKDKQPEKAKTSD